MRQSKRSGSVLNWNLSKQPNIVWSSLLCGILDGNPTRNRQYKCCVGLKRILFFESFLINTTTNLSHGPTGKPFIFHKMIVAILKRIDLLSNATTRILTLWMCCAMTTAKIHIPPLKPHLGPHLEPHLGPHLEPHLGPHPGRFIVMVPSPMCGLNRCWMMCPTPCAHSWC